MTGLTAPLGVGVAWAAIDDSHDGGWSVAFLTGFVERTIGLGHDHLNTFTTRQVVVPVTGKRGPELRMPSVSAGYTVQTNVQLVPECSSLRSEQQSCLCRLILRDPRTEPGRQCRKRYMCHRA